MKTIADIIENLGPSRLAEAFDVSVQAISNMKSRGAIPPRHWSAAIRVASEQGVGGVTFDLLERLSSAAAESGLPEQRAVVPAAKKRAGAR